jgi:RNA repair pathway DNA polymerase beta family
MLITTERRQSGMTRAEQLIAAVQQSGFPHLDSLIHLFVGGSELHGAKVKDTDDLDIYGVYLEPPELVLGLGQERLLRLEHRRQRAQERTGRCGCVPVFLAQMGGAGG